MLRDLRRRRRRDPLAGHLDELAVLFGRSKLFAFSHAGHPDGVHRRGQPHTVKNAPLTSHDQVYRQLLNVAVAAI
jgi:hypothetical protein